MPRWATYDTTTGIIVRIVEFEDGDERPTFEMGEMVREVGPAAKIGDSVTNGN